jgi:heptosyltransferase-3
LINPGINEFTYLDYGALLPVFSMAAGMKPLDGQPKFHLTKEKFSFALPGRYAVLHCKSAEKEKDWEYEKWKEIAVRLIAAGFCVVEIGLEGIIRLSDDRFLDMTKEHDIQKIASIIKNASFYMGIDSAFAHLANCFEIPALILLGKYKNFHKYLPYTGFYADHREEMLIYSMNGTVKNLSVEAVWERAALVMPK